LSPGVTPGPKYFWVMGARSTPCWACILACIFIGSDTRSKPDTHLKLFQDPMRVSRYFFRTPTQVFYYFILIQYLLFFNIIQLKILHGWNDYSTLSLHKKTRLMDYKYLMNPLSSKFTISLSLIFLAHIFSESISLKYHCIFSL